VSVAPFGATSFFQSEFGQTDVGGGLAAMLTNALVESNAFIVVERAQLSGVLAEQELRGAGLTQGTDAPKPGALMGARLRIAGEVTEFSEADKGKGMGLGVSLGSSRLSLSPQKRMGTVAMDIRIIDTLSAQVIAAFHVKETIETKAHAVNLGHKGYSLGSENFDKTPVGQAARRAITSIVTRFAEIAMSQAWSGAVVDVEGDQIAINAGAVSGIKVGDRFEVQRVSKVLTDPTTGRVLGQRVYTVGEVIVSRVDSELSYGQFFPTADVAADRGDIVLAAL
jgi:curli biogenesis system outer membrane secretion channel CsgG